MTIRFDNAPQLPHRLQVTDFYVARFARILGSLGRLPEVWRCQLLLILFCFGCLHQNPLVAQEADSSSEQITIEGDSAKKVVISPWEAIDVGSTAHFRGLHVVDDNVIWASGSNGTVVLSADGGNTWRQRRVEGAEDLDFRDIHGFDDGSAVIISSGEVAKIFRTTNGGRTWSFCGKKSGAFLDSISFWDDTFGVIMSDPIDGKFWLARTQDGGKTWKSVRDERVPAASPGEAGFAASGTNTCIVGDDTCFIGLGGAEENQSHDSSRILISTDRGKTWDVGGPVPIKRSASSGIFSLWFADHSRGVAVGGDYLKPDDKSSNYAVTEDGGKDVGHAFTPRSAKRISKLCCLLEKWTGSKASRCRHKRYGHVNGSRQQVDSHL